MSRGKWGHCGKQENRLESTEKERDRRWGVLGIFRIELDDDEVDAVGQMHVGAESKVGRARSPHCNQSGVSVKVLRLLSPAGTR